MDPLNPTQWRTAEFVVEGAMASAGSSAPRTINVFHYFRAAFVTNPIKASLATIFRSTVIAPMAAALNARWTAQRLRIRYLEDRTDAYEDTALNEVGAIAGDSQSSEKTAFFLLKTGLRGKTFRGAKHFGPISEADSTSTSDIFNAAAMTRLNTLGAALIADMTDAQGIVWRPCVVSRSGTDWTTQPVEVERTLITSYAINKRFGQIKRRRSLSSY